MRIGVVACGYADGYRASAPTGTPVLVDGVRRRTVGRVSMDMLTVDLSPCAPGGHGQHGHALGACRQRRGIAGRRSGSAGADRGV